MQLPAQDKLAHAVAGSMWAAGTTIAVALLCRSRITSDLGIWALTSVPLGVVIAVAIGKEIMDRRDPKHHTCDVWDAVATVLGAIPVVASVAAVLLTYSRSTG